MKLSINGTEVEAAEGQNVLEAALDAGIYIPHLCKHPDLEAVGGCRLCMVEVEGTEGPVCACKTPVAEGMVVNTTGESAERVRKMAMELILATHPTDCTGCPKYGKCELQSMYQYMGVSPTRWRVKSRPVATDDKNPLITHMFTRCIRCGRCVRACRELRGVGVLDYQHTEEGIRIGTDGSVSLQQAGCRFCGACIEVCPTGSIVDTLDMLDESKSYADNVVPCRSGCPAHVDIPRYLRHIRNGEYTRAAAVVREKVPFPESLGDICVHNCQGAWQAQQPQRHPGLGLSPEARRSRPRRGRLEGQRPPRAAHRQARGRRGRRTRRPHRCPLLRREGPRSQGLRGQTEKVGGQMRYGIPAYRLPDETVDAEVATILEISQASDPEPRIELVCGTRVADPKALLSEGFDAVLVTIGTHDGTVLPMAGHDLEGVVRNTDFLKAARKGEAEDLTGLRVMVLGGGNVAYDCARTALRLGAASVDMACLEAEAVMTSTPEERAEAAEEGVVLHDAYAFTSINESTEGSGKVGSMTIHKIERFYFDENHRAVTELLDGGEMTIDVDRVIFAVGQKPEGTRRHGLRAHARPLHRGRRRGQDERRGRLGGRRLRDRHQVRHRGHRRWPRVRQRHRPRPGRRRRHRGRAHRA